MRLNPESRVWNASLFPELDARFSVKEYTNCTLSVNKNCVMGDSKSNVESKANIHFKRFSNLSGLA